MTIIFLALILVLLAGFLAALYCVVKVVIKSTVDFCSDYYNGKIAILQNQIDELCKELEKQGKIVNKK